MYDNDLPNRASMPDMAAVNGKTVQQAQALLLPKVVQIGVMTMKRQTRWKCSNQR